MEYRLYRPREGVPAYKRTAKNARHAWRKVHEWLRMCYHECDHHYAWNGRALVVRELERAHPCSLGERTAGRALACIVFSTPAGELL